MRQMAFGFVLMVFALPCRAETIIVDQNGFADFNNIQDAIDYSYDGDTVIVKRGVYPEDIFFNSKAITLTGEDSNDSNVIAATIINGTVTFDFSEREDSILQGLTVAGKGDFPIYLLTTAGEQYSPAICGNILVWSDNRSGNYDIYGYDLTTGREFPICTAAVSQISPAIYGNTVVWQDNRSGNYDIYGYYLTTGQEFAVCTASGSQISPAIYGNTVVWSDNRSGNYDIYGCDLVTKQEFVVCSASADQFSPAIDGNTVVWEDYRSGSANSNIYGYNLVTQQEFVICAATGYQTTSAIYGNTVVWSDNRSGNYNIYGYDLVAKQEFVICTATGDQYSPAIYGNTVVWEDYRSGSANSNIYGFNLVTKNEFTICSATGHQTYPAIYGNTVVWQDYRSGNTHIYGYSLDVLFNVPRFINTGVICYDSFPTLAKNRFLGFQTALDCHANAMPGVQNNDFLNNAKAVVNCSGTISGNSFANDGNAIQGCSGTIINNTIAGSVAALSACTGSINLNSISSVTTALANCTGTIAENTITGANTGLSVCTGSITGNVVAQGKTGMSGCSGQIQGNTVSLNTNGFVSCNASFLNNIVTADGNGFKSCSGTISNNTITGSLGYAFYQNSAVIKNNIIAFNQVGIYGPASDSYNCFWQNSRNFDNGAYAKTGDFVADPKFAVNGVWDSNVWQEGDYHLKSTAGRFDPNTQTWVLDDVNSPCIDKGDPCDSIGYEPNPNGGRINVGNFGGTAYASKSSLGPGPDPMTTCTSPVEGDLNNDCKVDYEDFATLALHWLECNLDPPSACLQ